MMFLRHVSHVMSTQMFSRECTVHHGTARAHPVTRHIHGTHQLLVFREWKCAAKSLEIHHGSRNPADPNPITNQHSHVEIRNLTIPYSLITTQPIFDPSPQGVEEAS